MKETIKPYLKPAFLLCVAVLLLAAGSKRAVIEKLGLKLTKLPLPLQKPLDDMDQERLAPYKVVHKSKIANKDILESLGTKDYIQWFLEDTEEASSSPVRYCSLFITYYTGDPDRVPHVPEECITGGGDQLLSRDVINLSLDLGNTKISGLEAKDGKVDFEVRYLVFSSKGRTLWESDYKYGVLYFFKVNGDSAAGREGTRAIMGQNLFGKYSYFSKVEWKFYGQETGGGIVHAKKEDVRAASEKLLGVLLPILEDEHWPDWEKANAEEEENTEEEEDTQKQD